MLEHVQILNKGYCIKIDLQNFPIDNMAEVIKAIRDDEDHTWWNFNVGDRIILGEVNMMCQAINSYDSTIIFNVD